MRKYDFGQLKVGDKVYKRMRSFTVTDIDREKLLVYYDKTVSKYNEVAVKATRPKKMPMRSNKPSHIYYCKELGDNITSSIFLCMLINCGGSMAGDYDYFSYRSHCISKQCCEAIIDRLHRKKIIKATPLGCNCVKVVFSGDMKTKYCMREINPTILEEYGYAAAILLDFLKEPFIGTLRDMQNDIAWFTYQHLRVQLYRLMNYGLIIKNGEYYEAKQI